jgi:hypothetical protein
MEPQQILLNEIETAHPDDVIVVTPGEPEIDAAIVDTISQNEVSEEITEQVINESKNPFSGAEGENKVVAESAVTDEKVKFNLSELIDAGTVLDMIDWVLPLAMVFLFGKYDIEVDEDSLKMDSKEKKTLQKPLDKAFADTSVGTKNPWIGFLIVFLLYILSKSFIAYQAKKGQKGNKAIHEEQLEPELNAKDLKVKEAPKGKGKGKGRPPGSKNKKPAEQTNLLNLQ